MKKEKIKNIVLIIVVAVISSTITSFATSNYLYDSVDVKYNNNSSGVESDTVQGAIDELYVLANRVKDECPNDKVCLDYICKRATTLHQPTCNNSTGCSASGDVGNGNTITYGSIGTGNSLTAGEALDCKVSTTGGYTERFYYITDLESNSDYAVLLYSQDTSSGTVAYDSSNENWHGPQTAVSSLPTTSTWDNISLSSTNRQLYAWDHSNPDVYNTTTTNNGSNTLGTFSYSGYAGRLLTVKELRSACPNASTSTGSLSSCAYLMENTKYDNSSNTNYGYWLETPHASNSFSVWSVYGDVRNLDYDFAISSGGCGARPAIEVPKKLIKLD